MLKKEIVTLVIGSGAGGLGAAVWLKHKSYSHQYMGEDIYNKNAFMVVDGCDKLPMNMHNGVHYLHSVPTLPFESGCKKITLTDGILYNGCITHEPNLNLSLLYSEKVREFQHPSSIMNIGKYNSVFMPKGNSVNDLLEDCYKFAGFENFNFGYWIESIDVALKIAIFRKGDEIFQVHYKNLITTIPLNVLSKMLKIDWIDSLELKCSPVHVSNFEVEKIVPNWMINLYVPDLSTPVYRASILNGICSVESIRPLTKHELHSVRDTLSMFHFKEEEPKTFTWNTGKVVSIDMDDREKLVEILKSHGIYSIGRFGLWNRKLLVDSTINQAKSVVDHLYGEEWTITKDKLVK